MKIVNLIENTEGNPDCVSAHGLSFYVESKKHKLLLDLGPSGDTLKNAAALGIKLSDVEGSWRMNLLSVEPVCRNAFWKKTGSK